MPGDEFSTVRGRPSERQKLAILRGFLGKLGIHKTQGSMSSPSALAQPENDTTLFAGANASIWTACRLVGDRDARPRTSCLITATARQILSLPILGRSRAVTITSRPSPTGCVKEIRQLHVRLRALRRAIQQQECRHHE